MKIDKLKVVLLCWCVTPCTVCLAGAPGAVAAHPRSPGAGRITGGAVRAGGTAPAGVPGRRQDPHAGTAPGSHGPGKYSWCRQEYLDGVNTHTQARQQAAIEQVSTRDAGGSTWTASMPTRRHCTR